MIFRPWFWILGRSLLHSLFLICLLGSGGRRLLWSLGIWLLLCSLCRFLLVLVLLRRIVGLVLFCRLVLRWRLDLFGLFSLLVLLLLLIVCWLVLRFLCSRSLCLFHRRRWWIGLRWRSLLRSIWGWLPKGFRRTRDYGFLHGNASKTLKLIQWILQVMIDGADNTVQRPAFICSSCKNPMNVIGFRKRSWCSG